MRSPREEIKVGIGYDRGGFSQKEVEDMEENERQLHIFNSEKGKIGITARHLIHNSLPTQILIQKVSRILSTQPGVPRKILKKK